MGVIAAEQKKRSVTGRSTDNFAKQALLCSIELGSIKCNLETAKIGILPWENMSTAIAKLPKSDFAHL